MDVIQRVKYLIPQGQCQYNILVVSPSLIDSKYFFLQYLSAMWFTQRSYPSAAAAGWGRA